ncbi:MAG TPA: NFACT RNA binding domain-containing protein, partial [Longimicrobiaceae bacterium]|nr:NFACT RNA binding domain-containing protein [Longimicrobiaceae bacterium]
GRRRPGHDDTGHSLPYRLFRTSGGLEVRVGRGAKENDRLTFGESSPNDVWLHARSVPGSHVILRWPDPEGAPPARDLAEAATLAALFSRARTSGTVAVDWTRRKHVRKPRGAPPGVVIPQRVKTIFVEPDEAVAARMEKNSE